MGTDNPNTPPAQAGRADESVPAAMTVKNLSFAYGNNKIIRKMSLTVPKGKVTTIMGGNGCGKSTLFSLMTKNLEPAKGRIYLGKKNINDMTLGDFARKVAIVHQHNTASGDTTVEKLVSFGRTPYQNMMGGDHSEDEKYIKWALDVTGLTPFKDREVARLSGGQRQRVWIAMALAQNTEILLLDEPTTYLDIHYQLEILQLVRMLNHSYGITIVMVLHEINQAIRFSDNVVGMKGGKVLVQGDPNEVITSDVLYELYGIRLGVATIDGRKYVMI